MRVAAGGQLVLPVDQVSAADRWGQLPEQTRAEVLVLLARLIARGVLVADADADADADAEVEVGQVCADVGAGRG
jgi:hypothetical protein